jgi:hypothetical protein
MHRLRDRSSTERVALAMHGGWLAAGLALLAHPFQRSDPWTGWALLMTAAVGATPILLTGTDPIEARLRRRTRRIARLTNRMLAAVLALFTAGMLLGGGATPLEGAALLALIVFASFEHEIVVERATSIVQTLISVRPGAPSRPDRDGDPRA